MTKKESKRLLRFALQECDHVIFFTYRNPPRIREAVLCRLCELYRVIDRLLVEEWQQTCSQCMRRSWHAQDKRSAQEAAKNHAQHRGHFTASVQYVENPELARTASRLSR